MEKGLRERNRLRILYIRISLYSARQFVFRFSFLNNRETARQHHKEPLSNQRLHQTQPSLCSCFCDDVDREEKAKIVCLMEAWAGGDSSFKLYQLNK